MDGVSLRGTNPRPYILYFVLCVLTPFKIHSPPLLNLWPTAFITITVLSRAVFSACASMFLSPRSKTLFWLVGCALLTPVQLPELYFGDASLLRYVESPRRLVKATRP